MSANPIDNVAECLQGYVERQCNTIQAAAQKHFVIREVDVLYGFTNDELLPGRERDTILVGVWRRHQGDIRVAGLTVRFSANFNGICLAQSGIFGQWYIEWAPDAPPIVAPQPLRPSVSERAKKLGDAFREALDLNCPLGSSA